MTKWIAGLGLGAALAFAAPTTAEAQGNGPVVAGGLINVQIVDLIDGDVLSNNNLSVTAALSVAANICGVAVNVLAADFRQDGEATCETATQQVILTQQRGGRR